MDSWKFFDYIEPGGQRVSDILSGDAKATLDRLVGMLRVVSGVALKPGKHIKDLKGPKNVGLLELRFRSERIQHRPIGCYGPGRREFTILYCATEVGGKFRPSAALDIARKRRDEIRSVSGRSVILEH